MSISQSMTSAERLHSLDNTFCDALASSISALLGRNVHIVAAPPGPFGSAGLWFQAEFAPVANGAVAFGGLREAWLKLGGQLLAAAGIEDAGSDLIISTLHETSAQVMDLIASALSGFVGYELSANTVAPEVMLSSSAQSYRISSFRITAEGVSEVDVTFLIAPQLLDFFASKDLVRTGSPALNTKNLELLMDVEMPVSISFGHAQLPLKDVIKLTIGSIVELNRSVSEPVDIVVNNCTVARGEVVVVEGNFGVRIKEVLSKEDRLKTLC